MVTTLAQTQLYIEIQSQLCLSLIEITYGSEREVESNSDKRTVQLSRVLTVIGMMGMDWEGLDMDETSVSQLSIAYAEGGSQLCRNEIVKVPERRSQ